MSKYDDYEYQKTNREKRMTPKTGAYWCDGCDRDYVGYWAKCSVCGWRQGKYNNKKVLKKETNA